MISGAFGYTRYGKQFAVASNDAGTRINPRTLTCVDWLAMKLGEWPGTGFWPLEWIFQFFYPFVGTSAVSNRFNLVDPAKFQIQWSGGVTHDYNGVTGNGSTGYGDTLCPLTGGTVTDSYVLYGVYSRTASSVDTVELGNESPTGVDHRVNIWCRNSAGSATCFNGVTTAYATGAVANSQGLLVGMRSTGVFLGLYRNGVRIGSNVTTAPTPPDPAATFAILRAGTTTGSFSSRNLALAFLTFPAGYGGTTPNVWTDAKMTELYNIVQQFQTMMLR